MNLMVLDAEDYGAFSVPWMIKQAGKHVPRERLELGFDAAVNYAEVLARGGSAMAPSDVLDVLAQFILTGNYVPTAFRDDPDEEDDDAITEQEIADFMEGLSTDPEADDPMDGYKL